MKSSLTFQNLFNSELVRHIEQELILAHQIDGYRLMEQAGMAAFKVISDHYSGARTLSVVTGGGNNAGDGFVLARLAHQAGMDVRIYPVVAPALLKCDALNAYENYVAAGGTTLPFIPQDFEGTEILVDALFGTGLDRPVQGIFLETIIAMNKFRWDCSEVQSISRHLVSLDVPSGLHANSGSIMGQSIKADLTVTFITNKLGLYTGEGPEHTGKVILENLDSNPLLDITREPSARRLSKPTSPLLPSRSRSGHKGLYGHVLVVGGDHGMSGSVQITSRAALRVGAGLVSLVTRSAPTSFDGLFPEIMTHSTEDPSELEPLLGRATVLALGPGLGKKTWGKAIFDRCLEAHCFKVIDADALNLLAENPQPTKNSILTPHPGEAARLLGTTTRDVQNDRFAAIRALHERFGGTIVLKGSGSIVYDGSAPPCIVSEGNPGMSSGGMGDLLTGIIAGLIAQGLSLSESAILGTYLHGHAGDLAADEHGEIGLTASDLLTFLPLIINGKI